MLHTRPSALSLLPPLQEAIPRPSPSHIRPPSPQACAWQARAALARSPPVLQHPNLASPPQPHVTARILRRPTSYHQALGPQLALWLSVCGCVAEHQPPPPSPSTTLSPLSTTLSTPHHTCSPLTQPNPTQPNSPSPIKCHVPPSLRLLPSAASRLGSHAHLLTPPFAPALPATLPLCHTATHTRPPQGMEAPSSHHQPTTKQSRWPSPVPRPVSSPP
jgi:hypothetical protein